MSHCPPSACAGCPVSKVRQLKQLGVDMDKWDFVVALAGNANTGKSTIFNRLTGLHQHTGNWPGKTISRAEGGFRAGGYRYKLIDLPGTYSLLSATPDEEVARDFILFGGPDVTVIVADATRLERNLNLVLQVLQITGKAVLCLNLMDEAKAYGLEVDVRGLARELGIPVVPTAARSGEGMDQLIENIIGVGSGEIVCRPPRFPVRNPQIKHAVHHLLRQIEKIYPDLPHKEWIAMRLLEGDRSIVEAVRTGEIGQLSDDHASELAEVS